MDVPDVVPLLPLPDHVLLIGLPTPYRIFEPRYRDMVDDLIAQEPSRRYIAVPRLLVGSPGPDPLHPAISDIAALAVVRNIRPLENGQFLIIVEGLVRCRLEECPSSRLYRLARPHIMTDPSGDPDATAIGQALDAVLVQVEMLRRRLGRYGAVIQQLTGSKDQPGHLIDRLGAALIADLDLRDAFLHSRTIVERISYLGTALEGLLSHPPPLDPGRWDPSPN